MITIEKSLVEAMVINSKSMTEAARKLGITLKIFKRIAKGYGLYKPNPSGKGMTKKPKSIITLDGLNNGLFPNVQSYKLKHWLFRNNIKQNKCEICGITLWNNKTLECQLHHKDGNKHNNRIDNISILCPNCHSQTET